MQLMKNNYLARIKFVVFLEKKATSICMIFSLFKKDLQILYHNGNYLPSSILTKFIATSSQPVYCCPFTNRQGIPRLSAKTYIIIRKFERNIKQFEKEKNFKQTNRTSTISTVRHSLKALMATRFNSIAIKVRT